MGTTRLVYDAQNKDLIASVSGRGHRRYGKSVVYIDPFTGVIESTNRVESQPGRADDVYDVVSSLIRWDEHGLALATSAGVIIIDCSSIVGSWEYFHNTYSHVETKTV